MPGAVWQRCRTHYAANLMSVTPKVMWPADKTMSHSVYDQPDAQAVQAKFDRLLDYVETNGRVYQGKSNYVTYQGWSYP